MEEIEEIVVSDSDNERLDEIPMAEGVTGPDGDDVSEEEEDEAYEEEDDDDDDDEYDEGEEEYDATDSDQEEEEPKEGEDQGGDVEQPGDSNSQPPVCEGDSTCPPASTGGTAPALFGASSPFLSGISVPTGFDDDNCMLMDDEEDEEKGGATQEGEEVPQVDQPEGDDGLQSQTKISATNVVTQQPAVTWDFPIERKVAAAVVVASERSLAGTSAVLALPLDQIRPAPPHVASSLAPMRTVIPAASPPRPPIPAPTQSVALPFFSDQSYSMRTFLQRRTGESASKRPRDDGGGIAAKFGLCWPTSVLDENLRVVLQRHRSELMM